MQLFENQHFSNAFRSSAHLFFRRSFARLDCTGMYDRSSFAALDSVCDDCYNLYKEPEVHSLCRSDCFTSAFFRRCVDSLMLQEKKGMYDSMAAQLAGGSEGSRAAAEGGDGEK